jgi:hypothetical protein
LARVEIHFADETIAGMDLGSAQFVAELRVAAAAKWYELGRVSQEVAARIGGVSRSEFVSILREFEVSPMQENVDEALAGATLLRQP